MVVVIECVLAGQISWYYEDNGLIEIMLILLVKLVFVLGILKTNLNNEYQIHWLIWRIKCNLEDFNMISMI
jgi:hypothetical protein